MYIKRLQKSKEDALYIVGLYQCIFLPSYIFKMAFNGAVPKTWFVWSYPKLLLRVI